MKNAKLLFPALAILVLSFSLAWADHPMERGRDLFKDPHLSGGVIACNSCHPGGAGLEEVAGKTEFTVRGETFDTLEEVVNYWLEYGNMGRPLEVDSHLMRDLVAYIKSRAEDWERDMEHN